jgi:GGDEF domain-containing protein
LLLIHFQAVQIDDQREADQRQALRAALEEARSVIGEFPSLEHQALRLLERSSGVKSLKLEPNAAATDSNLQSVLDRNGRIIAWLSFAPDRPLSSFLNRLWPLTAGFLVLLVAMAGLLIWQLRTLLALEGDSELRAQSLKTLDPIAGVADHKQALELVDQMLAARRPDQVTVIADFDLDHFKDINDGMGHDVGDQVLATIGERLRSAIPAGAVCGRLGGDEFVVVINTENTERRDAGRERLARNSQPPGLGQ